jgi:hypothetical protein
MSRSNIIAMGPISKETFVVAFKTRSGLRAYSYDMADGLLIAVGGDPVHYQGSEVDAWTVIEALGQNAEDLVEVLA